MSRRIAIRGIRISWHPDFLLALEERVREFEHEGRQAARDHVRGLLGLSLDKYVCPECVPGE